MCWGNDGNGELGDGFGVTVTGIPVPVVGISDAVQVGAGLYLACARRASGTVACWGSDTSGQLGARVPLTIPLPQLARIACR